MVKYFYFYYNMDYNYLSGENNEWNNEILNRNTFENKLLNNELHANREYIRELMEENENNEEENNEEENTEYYDVITSSIIAGKELLIENLSNYKKKISKKDEEEKKIFDFKLHVSKMKDAISNLKKIITSSHIENEKFLEKMKLFDMNEISNIELQFEDIMKEKIKTTEKEIQNNSFKLKHLIEAYEIYKNMNLPPICTICLLNPVCIMNLPCGHTFCRMCQHKYKCHICRQKIETTNDVYFN